MAAKLEIVKIDDSNVKNGQDIKNIPFFRGKIVINMNSAWGNQWDRYAVWLSPCGDKISNLTQAQYMQLVNLGVPTKKRPTKSEVDDMAHSLKDLWGHYDIMRYLRTEHGIKIDLEETEEDDDEDEEESTEVPMEGITINLLPEVSMTKSPTKFNGVALYYFVVRIDDKHTFGVQVEVNTYQDSIVGVTFMKGNSYYKDKRKMPTAAISYSVSELSTRLNTDLDNVFALGNALRRATNRIHNNLPDSLKRYFTDDFRIWNESFSSYQISIRA